MKKRNRKLGSLQKLQQSATEFRVGEYLDWCKRNNPNPLFGEIKRATGIDNKVLRNALDRMMEKKEVIEFPMIHTVTRKKINRDRYLSPRKYVTRAKGYKLVSEEEYEKFHRERKTTKRLIQKREKLEKPKHKEKNSLLKKWTPPMSEKQLNDLIRVEIFKAMIKIDYFKKNEEKVLDEVGLTKKTYESWIKRSTRLQWLRNKLIEYKNKNQQLPLEISYGEYKISHSLTWIKRDFQYPNEVKRYWFRKKS